MKEKITHTMSKLDSSFELWFRYRLQYWQKYLPILVSVAVLDLNENSGLIKLQLVTRLSFHQ